MKIETKPHIGQDSNGPVDHGQDIVYCDGVQVGYIGRGPNSWLSCIVSMSKETKAELEAAINKHLNTKIGGVASLPVPEPIEEEDDEDELDLEDDD